MRGTERGNIMVDFVFQTAQKTIVESTFLKSYVPWPAWLQSWRGGVYISRSSFCNLGV